MKTHTKNFAQGISPNTRYGLYLIHSETKANFYRIGASGISSTNAGDAGLLKRLKQYEGPPPKKVENSNTSLMLKPWKPLWVCELGEDANKSLTIFAEAALFYHFEKIYPLSTASGEFSMFITTDDPEKVVRAADPFEQLLTRLAKVMGVVL